MSKPAPATAHDPIAGVVELARAALASVSSGLLEETATAKQGARATEDAIAALERGLALVRYEALRQADVAKRRQDRAAVDAALVK